MIRIILNILRLVCLLAVIGAGGDLGFSNGALAARTETIAAIVNDDAVSSSDVAARVKLVMASSGLPDQEEIRERLTPQILNVLIEEQLKLQEAARLDLHVSEAEIEEGFAAIAEQNKFTKEQFAALLAKEGIEPATLRDQVRAQLAWNKVIQAQLQPQITITDREIDAVMSRLRAALGKTEYRVSEILLPVNEPGQQADALNLAQRLIRQLVEGNVPFQRLASQFSQSPGATRGGDMGWVQEGQLPEELDAALANMNEGELSQPVRSLSGYHILYLHKKRAISEDTLPTPDQVRNQLGLERLDRLQRRHLLDLKTAAFIERRV